MTAAFVFGTVAKVTLVFVVGWGFAGLLRSRAASLRHLVWTATVVAAVAIAPMSRLLPSVKVPLPAAALQEGAAGAAVVSDAAPQAAVSAPDALPTTEGAMTAPLTPAAEVTAPQATQISSPASTLFLLWLIGVATVLGWYGLGHLGIAALVRRAAPVIGGPWPRVLHGASARGGVASRIRLLRSRAVGSPVLWGIRRPVILLPADAERWPEERAWVVLEHELAHARRFDGAVQLAAMVTCALYWFHPLAWLATRRLKNESERACDDAVLALGASGSEYATHLLEVARGAHHLRIGGSAVIGMARPSHLEGRLLAVLDERRERHSGAWMRAIVGGSLMAIVVPLAAANPSRSEVPPTPRLPQLAAITALPPLSVVPPAAHDTVFDRSVDTRPGETLTLDLDSGGRVEIRGWDEPRVTIRVRLGGRDWRDTDVEVSRVSDGVRVAARQTGGHRSSSTAHVFEIRVPHRFNVRLESAGGAVSISDVHGTFTGQTGGGDLAIDRTSGRVDLRTGGGEIRVTDSDLDGAVGTGGGQVVLSGVSRGLTATSGSGPVISGVSGATGSSGTVTGAGESHGVIRQTTVSGNEITQTLSTDGGPVVVTKAGGRIILDDAPNGATIRTGGGDIRVAQAGGPIEAHTGGGDIVLGRIAGSVRATSGAGHVQVRIEGTGEDQRPVSVVTVGDVVLDLPEGLLMEFDLESAYTQNFERATRIESDWELRREETDRWDDSRGTPRRYVRATGTVGDASGGPVSLIHVRTVNGDITIRHH